MPGIFGEVSLSFLWWRQGIQDPVSLLAARWEPRDWGVWYSSKEFWFVHSRINSAPSIYLLMLI